jgi:hypothetical protein
MNTRYHWLNVLLDSAALIIAVLVDLTLNVICMVTIAPGPLEKIGFAAIAFVVVLFAIRSWILGNKWLWVMFVLVSAFFDLSFTLIATDVQTTAQAVVVTVETDSELVRLTEKSDAARAALKDLREQYRLAMRRDTLRELDDQIKAADVVAAQAEAARVSRIARIESGELNAQAREQRSSISATMIFGAIPEAVSKGRWVPIIVFALIFSGLQLVMITAADSVRGKSARRPGRPRGIARETAPDHLREYVDTWVHTSWIGRRNGRTTKVLDRDSFNQFMRNQGKTFPGRRYREIAAAALASGVIDGMGEIVERDEGQAQKKIVDCILTKTVNSNNIKSDRQQPERQQNLF